MKKNVELNEMRRDDFLEDLAKLEKRHRIGLTMDKGFLTLVDLHDGFEIASMFNDHVLEDFLMQEV